MNGITELAKLLKERENVDGYSPMFGTVIELPNTKIRIFLPVMRLPITVI